MGLDDFGLGAPLGAGATAQVYAGVHRTSGVRVALKMVQPHRRAEAIGLERELAALAGLDHPSVLHLYDHGVVGDHPDLEAGTHWMALEYASGGSLLEAPPSTWDEVREQLLAVLSGLGHAHARGVIHRDLKPGNLLVCTGRDERPGLKIADFGLAWATHGGGEGVLRAGSPAYMPPEQIRAETDALGPWTDLYALGCVAWEWVTGAPPFGWLEVRPALRAHQVQPVPALHPRFEVPAGLEVLLRALLAKDWRERPSSAARVHHAVSRLGRARGVRLPTRLMAVPVRWRSGESAPSTSVLLGAGLGLFALRDPAVVGRTAEQGRLWEALRRASTTSKAEVVALTGPVGVGRARLARWLGERAAELGCATVVRAPPPGELVRLPSTASLAELATTGPVVVDLSGRPHDEALAELCGQLLLGRSGPVVVLLSGAHEAPLFGRLDSLRGFTRIALSALPLPVLANFLNTHLGLARGPADLVAAASAGNPGLAVSWVRGWVGRGDLEATPSGFQPVAGVDLLAAPSLDEARHAQVEAVLASLSEPARLAAGLGALLGAEVLAAEWRPLMARHDIAPRHSPLRALARANLGRPTPTGWVLADAAVRAALLAELDRHGPRQTFHGHAADVLATLSDTVERVERRGRHLLAAGRRDEAWGVLRVALSRRRAEARWTDVRAIVELLERAGGERDPGREYAVTYYGAVAVSNLEGPRHALAYLRRGLAVVDRMDAGDAGRMRRLAVGLLTLADAHDEARAALAHVDTGLPQIRRIVATLELEEGRYESAIAHLEALHDEGDDDVKRLTANELGRAEAARGDRSAAEGWFQRCLDLSSGAEGFVPAVNIALLRVVTGRVAEALPLAVRAEALVRDQTLAHRGHVALIASVVAVACRNDELFDVTWERALYHVRSESPEPDSELVQAIAVARERGADRHRRFLDLLEERYLRP